MLRFIELNEWEKRLQEKVDYVELLGELDMVEEDVKHNGALFADLLRTCGQTKALQELRVSDHICSILSSQRNQEALEVVMQLPTILLTQDHFSLPLKAINLPLYYILCKR